MKDYLAGMEGLEIGVMTPGKFAGFLLVCWGALTAGRATRRRVRWC